jgi:hypothetical protein
MTDAIYTTRVQMSPQNIEENLKLKLRFEEFWRYGLTIRVRPRVPISVRVECEGRGSDES